MTSPLTYHWRTCVVIGFLCVALLSLSISACKQAGSAVHPMITEPNEALSGGDGTVQDASVNAFALPMPALSAQDELVFFVGNSFFNQNWVQAPASTDARDGLGPHFNAKSCSGCHFKDGRGQPPAQIGQLSEGFLIRLSIPGQTSTGAPMPDPIYGGQFQEHGIDQAKPEGQFEIIWEPVHGKYPDGTAYTLRKPQIRFFDLQYGNMHAEVMTSPRVAPQMIGLGLLEAIDEKTILAQADPDDSDQDGISGRANYVWNVIDAQQQLGRFGWKANEPTLLQQISGAFNGDMGITTPYFSDQHITSAQKELLALANGGDPEMPEADLQKLHLYCATLAVPARRNVDNSQVLRGKQLFLELGCDNCHTQTITTATHPQFAVLNQQTIHPYTDLLLHDMGAGLADGRPDFLASGTEWRTPPLWGIGLFQTVNKHTYYLHDGRARNLEEAILWHGGEAATAQQQFMQLSKDDRARLILLLESL